MHGYIAFYGERRIEIYADSAYAAQLKAIEQFKPSKSKRHLVTVHLAELNGQQVTHTATE